MNKTLQRILIVFISIMPIYVLLSIYTDYLIKDLITKQAKELSSKNYQLETGNIKTGLWNFRAEIEDLKISRLKPLRAEDSRYYYTITASSVKLQNLHLFDLLFSKNLQLQKLIIQQPHITLHYNDTISKVKSNDSTLYQLYYKLNEVVLNNANIEVHKSSGEKLLLNLHHLSYDIKDLHLYIDTISIKGINCTRLHFDYSTQVQQASLKGFNLNTLLNYMQFSYSSFSANSLKLRIQAHSLNKAYAAQKPYMLNGIKTVSGKQMNHLTIKNIDISYRSRNDVADIKAHQFYYAGKQVKLQQIFLKLKQKHLTEYKITSISIEGLDANQLIDQKHTSIKKIIINQPVITSILGVNAAYKKPEKNSQDHIGYSIDSVTQLLINKGNVKLSENKIPNKYISIHDINFSLKHFDPQYFYNFSEIPPPKEIEASTGGVDVNFKGNIYHLKIKHTAYHSNEKILHLDSLKIQSNYDKKTFYSKVKKQVARIDLSVKKLSLTDFDISKLLSSSKLTANELQAQQVQVNFYKNKQIPLGANEYKKFPQELIQDISYPFHIKKVTLKDSYLRSETLNQAGHRAAEITIDQMQATFAPVDNSKYKGNVMKAMLQGRLANSGKMVVEASFDMYALDFKHQLHAEIRSMPFQKLNDFMFDFASIEISSGNLNKAIIDIIGNNKKLHCDLNITYNNLSMNLIKNQNKQHKRYRNIASALANTVIYKNNPEPDKKIRLSTTMHQYESNKFIVGNWLTGSFKALLITTVPKAAQALNIIGVQAPNDSLPPGKTPKWLQRFLKKRKLK
jgi:hypothetical protein